MMLSVFGSSEPFKTREKRPFLVAVISFFLSLILTAALSVAIPATFLNFLLTDHNIEVIVDHVFDTVELDKIEIQTPEGKKNISGIIVSAASEIEGLNTITEEQIDTLLRNEATKQFITDTLKKFGLSLKQGKELLEGTPDQIYAFLETNRESIENLAREAGYEGEIPIVENKELIISSIDQAIGNQNFPIESILGENEAMTVLSELLDKAQLIFSVSALCFVWGIVGFTAILLLFLNIKFFGCFCSACGFPAFIVGGIYTLITYAVDPLLAMVSIKNEIVAEVINFTAGFSTALLRDISFPTAITGGVLLIVSLIARICRR